MSPGCIAMLPEMPEEMREAAALGISFFAGEAEHGRLDQVIRDAWDGALQPLYNYMSDLPSLEGEPAPILPRKHVRRVSGQLSSLDLGRGCPYQCSFCTIINVQGRKSRFRSPDDLERAIRENYRQGNRRFFITDDNFARNRHWEPLFDRMIQLRVGEGLKIGFTIQVDTLCHRIPNFIEKAAQAGVRRVFIGLENINPDNLLAAKKRQNKITEYRAMLQKWREHGAITCAGYIIGFPGDTRESILRDIEIIKRELPLDVLELFMLTPLPGSEDHKVLWQQGAWMDPDLNKYDLNNRVTHHPVMSDDDWDDAYRAAWQSFYSLEHVRTVLRRAAAHPRRPAAHDIDHIAVVQADDDVRGRPPARRRRLSPQVAAGPPLWAAAGEPFRVLPALCRRDRLQGLALLVGLSKGAGRFSRKSSPRPTGGPTAISRSPRRARMNSTGSISITRPPAARGRWPVSAARTLCGARHEWSCGPSPPAD